MVRILRVLDDPDGGQRLAALLLVCIALHMGALMTILVRSKNTHHTPSQKIQIFSNLGVLPFGIKAARSFLFHVNKAGKKQYIAHIGTIMPIRV
jgi:hypothetical protein